MEMRINIHSVANIMANIINFNFKQNNLPEIRFSYMLDILNDLDEGDGILENIIYALERLKIDEKIKDKITNEIIDEIKFQYNINLI